MFFIEQRNNAFSIIIILVTWSTQCTVCYSNWHDSTSLCTRAEIFLTKGFVVSINSNVSLTTPCIKLVYYIASTIHAYIAIQCMT